jgi:hypothetical protein
LIKISKSGLLSRFSSKTGGVLDLKKQKIEITSRDTALFHLLWRWKFLSTAAISAKFFPGGKGDTAYRRLRLLQSAGCLKPTFDESFERFYWQLNLKARDLAQAQLPPMPKIDLRSKNIALDALTTALHLGDWLSEIPKDSEVITARELESLPEDSRPSWVPSTGFHCPKGYWRTVNKGKPITVALEVELSVKRKRDYSTRAHFYQWEKSVHRSVWLVANLNAAKRIQSFLKGFCEDSYLFHNFLTLKEFQTNRWLGSFCLGIHQNETLASLVAPQNDYSKINPSFCGTLLLLDSSKIASRTLDYHPPAKRKKKIVLKTKLKKLEARLEKLNLESFTPAQMSKLSNGLSDMLGVKSPFFDLNPISTASKLNPMVTPVSNL